MANNLAKLGWAEPHPESFALKPSDVHVWAIDLKATPKQLRELATLLSQDEKERAARYKYDADRERYMIARGTLRKLLGKYLRIEPEKIGFRFENYGKPVVEPCTNLHFNLTHSGELALLAVTQIDEVGIDLEGLRPISDLMAIAERYFTENEQSLIRSVPEQAAVETFFNFWVRKEAYAKAIGKGMNLAFNRIEVSLGSEESPRFLRFDAGQDDPLRWQLFALQMPATHVAAVALRADKASLYCWKAISEITG